MSDQSFTVRNAQGEKVGEISVPSMLVSNGKPHLLHQTVRWQRAKRRAGTHSVLTRGDASGGGIKPWKQKGTGRARAGSNTSPIWVGGGVAHGPKPRKYGFAVNKKELRQALRSAMTARHEAGRLFVVESFGLTEGKTREAQEVLKRIGINRGEKSLIVVAPGDEISQRCLRNIAGVKVLPPHGVNVYDVLAATNLVFTAEGCRMVEERLTKGRE